MLGERRVLAGERNRTRRAESVNDSGGGVGGHGNDWMEISCGKSVDRISKAEERVNVKGFWFGLGLPGSWHGCRGVGEGQNGSVMAGTKPTETAHIDRDWVEYRMAGLEPLECKKEAVLADNVLVGMAYGRVRADPVKQFLLGKGQGGRDERGRKKKALGVCKAENEWRRERQSVPFGGRDARRTSWLGSCFAEYGRTMVAMNHRMGGSGEGRNRSHG